MYIKAVEVKKEFAKKNGGDKIGDSLKEGFMEAKKIPPRMRSHDSCEDCWGSVWKEEDGKERLWCEKYEFNTDESGLCDEYVE